MTMQSFHDRVDDRKAQSEALLAIACGIANLDKGLKYIAPPRFWNSNAIINYVNARGLRRKTACSGDIRRRKLGSPNWRCTLAARRVPQI
jgi:hypothetical protein